jgi:hypothetical protein
VRFAWHALEGIQNQNLNAVFFNSVPIPPQALMLMVVKWSILDSMQLVFSSHNLSKLELATIQTKFNFTFAFIRKPESLPDNYLLPQVAVWYLSPNHVTALIGHYV